MTMISKRKHPLQNRLRSVDTIVTESIMISEHNESDSERSQVE